MTMEWKIGEIKQVNGDVIISKPYPTRDEAIHNSTELTIDTVNIEWEE